MTGVKLLAAMKEGREWAIRARVSCKCLAANVPCEASCTHEWIPHSGHAAPQVAAHMAHAALSAAANQLCPGGHSMALAALSIAKCSALPCRLHHAFTMQAQVAELKDVKGDAAKFEACAKAAHELLAEGEKLKVKMEAEMEALKVGCA